MHIAEGWYTPLHLALGNGWFETASYLLDVGADVKAKNKFGLDVYALAVKKGFEDLSKRFYLVAKVKLRNKKLSMITGDNDSWADSIEEECGDFDDDGPTEAPPTTTTK